MDDRVLRGDGAVLLDDDLSREAPQGHAAERDGLPRHVCHRAGHVRRDLHLGEQDVPSPRRLHPSAGVRCGRRRRHRERRVSHPRRHRGGPSHLYPVDHVLHAAHQHGDGAAAVGGLASDRPVDGVHHAALDHDARHRPPRAKRRHPAVQQPPARLGDQGGGGARHRPRIDGGDRQAPGDDGDHPPDAGEDRLVGDARQVDDQRHERHERRE
mmetsp:Transcript_35040/g.87263  ORF Transcript_35040/g.87263 Transcript_35040/m.87263 type:complete len:212 (+) Transcript_35040:514-1149(+)